MKTHLVRAGRTLPFAVILLFQVVAGGCGGEQKAKVKTLACDNQIVKVDPNLDKGVDRKAVYLCNSYNVQWVTAGNVASFEVEFVDPPFPFGNTTKFGTAPGETTMTPAYSAPGDLTVYKYKITIVDRNGKTYTFDPHVVGGGGL
jgi:hypothetical protein